MQHGKIDDRVSFLKTLDGWCQVDKAIPWSRSEAQWVKGSYPRLEASLG